MQKVKSEKYQMKISQAAGIMIRRFKNHKRKNKKKKNTGEVDCQILVFTERKKTNPFFLILFFFCKKQTFLGLPWWLSGKESACQCRRHRRCGFNQEYPLRKGMATCSSILAWRIPWTEEPSGYNPRGQNESDTM